MRGFTRCFLLAFVFAAAIFAAAQGDYKVISVTDGGSISGTVKWSGPVPHDLANPRRHRGLLQALSLNPSTTVQLRMGLGGLWFVLVV